MDEEIKKSQEMFQKLINDSGIMQILKGRIAFLECDDRYAQFDMTAGLDSCVVEEMGLRGVGFRYLTKYGDCSTMTIRYKLPSNNPTEFDKRKFALLNLEEGYIYPYWTVTAYIDNSTDRNFICYYVTKTKDLIEYAERFLSQLSKPLVGEDMGYGRIQMLVIHYKHYIQSGYACYGVKKNQSNIWVYLEGSATA